MKSAHGGSRPNSGRPKGKPTKVLHFRVPLKKADTLKFLIKELIKRVVK